MLNEFDEFVRFCFEHGGTLRNHKAFGEMAQKLRVSIESAQQSVHPTVLQVGQGVATCPKCFTAWVIEFPKSHSG